MGFSISWFGFENRSKAQVLALFGLRDLGDADEANEAMFSVAELPTGWTILFVNDYGFGGDGERLAALSESGYVVVCQAEEHVMASAARGYRDGREEWEVARDSSCGRYKVEVRGRPPERLAEIHRRLVARQRAAGDESRIDYLFDAPVELAASETGYRHDRFRLDWGQPQFTAAEPTPGAA